MSKQRPIQHRTTQQGVAIIEALIAILIFSIGVLGIVGMQANMVKNTTDSKYRTDASNIAQQRIGMLWADPTNLNSYAESGAQITDLPGGNRSTVINGVSVSNGTQVTVTVSWQQPGERRHWFTTIANIGGA